MSSRTKVLTLRFNIGRHYLKRRASGSEVIILAAQRMFGDTEGTFSADVEELMSSIRHCEAAWKALDAAVAQCKPDKASTKAIGHNNELQLVQRTRTHDKRTTLVWTL